MCHPLENFWAPEIPGKVPQRSISKCSMGAGEEGLVIIQLPSVIPLSTEDAGRNIVSSHDVKSCELCWLPFTVSFLHHVEK